MVEAPLPPRDFPPHPHGHLNLFPRTSSRFPASQQHFGLADAVADGARSRARAEADAADARSRARAAARGEDAGSRAKVAGTAADGAVTEAEADEEPFSPSPRFRRQRSFAASFSSLGGCLCSNDGCCELDFRFSYPKDFVLCRASSVAKSAPSQQTGQAAWWQESWRLLGSRRKPNYRENSDWADDGLGNDELYYRPPRWKLFLRKLRAKTRKMNCSKPASPGFQYDALSYAMNFDDGCWHQSDQQVQYASRFSGPILMESASYRGG